MNRQLLLDFDGVILKNKILTQYQLNRSARFVKDKACIPLNVAKHVNKQYYPKYGHTVTMLNELFINPVTLEEYNDYVFHDKTIKYLTKYICKSTYQHGNEFNKLLNYCEKNNTNWYIYSNAHINWINIFSESLDLHIPTDKIIYPTDLSLLKPKLKSYESIENRFSGDSHFIFIDDQQRNLPITRKRWSTYHYKQDSSSINDIINYINKIF